MRAAARHPVSLGGLACRQVCTAPTVSVSARTVTLAGAALAWQPTGIGWAPEREHPSLALLLLAHIVQNSDKTTQLQRDVPE